MAEVHEPEAEGQHEQRADADEHDADAGQAEQERDLGGRVASPGGLEADAGDDRSCNERERAEQVEEERDVLH